jgi:O-antigen ligase
MLIWFFIIYTCFSPILESFIPSTQFGEGLPDLSFRLLISFLLVLFFMLDLAIMRYRPSFNKWLGFILCYSVLAVAGVSWSLHSYDKTMMVAIYRDVFMLLVVALCAFRVFQEKNNMYLYMKCMAVTGLITGLLSTLQMIYAPFASMAFGGQMAELERVTGIFSNPNGMAIFLVFTIPCTIFCIERGKLNRFLGYTILVCIFSGIICTVSRKGVATAALSFVIFHFFSRNYRKVFIAMLVAFFAALVLSGISIYSERFSENRFRKSFEGKWELMQAGLKMFVKNPIIGLGHDGYRDHYREYFPWSPRQKYDVHNMYVRTLVNYGSIGILFFMGIFFVPLYLALKRIRQWKYGNTDEESFHLAIFCLSTLLPFMISGWFAGGIFPSPVFIPPLYAQVGIFLTAYYLTAQSNLEEREGYGVGLGKYSDSPSNA